MPSVKAVRSLIISPTNKMSPWSPPLELELEFILVSSAETKLLRISNTMTQIAISRPLTNPDAAHCHCFTLSFSLCCFHSPKALKNDHFLIPRNKKTSGLNIRHQSTRGLIFV